MFQSCWVNVSKQVILGVRMGGRATYLLFGSLFQSRFRSHSSIRVGPVVLTITSR